MRNTEIDRKNNYIFIIKAERYEKKTFFFFENRQIKWIFYLWASRNNLCGRMKNFFFNPGRYTRLTLIIIMFHTCNVIFFNQAFRLSSLELWPRLLYILRITSRTSQILYVMENCFGMTALRFHVRIRWTRYMHGVQSKLRWFRTRSRREYCHLFFLSRERKRERLNLNPAKLVKSYGLFGLHSRYTSFSVFKGFCD